MTKAAPPSRGRTGEGGAESLSWYYGNSERFSGGHTSTADSSSTGHVLVWCDAPPLAALVCRVAGAAEDSVLDGGDDGGCSHTTASCPLIFSGVGW